VSDSTEQFEQFARGIPVALLLVSPRDGEILGANPKARDTLDLAPTTKLDVVFEEAGELRRYLDACARSLQPLPGALRRGTTVYHVTGWRLARDRDELLLRLEPRGESGNFALLSQKLDELAREVKQRRAAEQALVALQQVTAELSAARTPAEIARVVLSRGIGALGAENGVVFRLVDDVVEIIDAVDYPPELVERFRRVPLDADLPAAEAIRTGRPVLLGSPEERRQRYGFATSAGALVALPLRIGERVFGAIGFGFAQTQPFTGTELERMHAFVEVTAQAFDRALLYETVTIANRRKDEFLAMLGHELRNPLAPIQTAIELIRLRDPAAFTREISVIERQTRQLGMLVDDILDVTRIAAGKIQLRRRVERLDDTVRRAIDTVSPVLERRGHTLELDIPAPIFADADHDRLAQVITNLLDNAAKYTPDRGTIRLSLVELGEWAELRVADNGRGISPDLLPRIFEPFVQDERSGARTPGGLGLGLAIVKGILDLHGGTASVASEGPGMGSEFVVRLACVPRAALEPARSTASHLPGATAARRGHVLVVDDNPDVAQMLGETLAEIGYVTRVALDGPSALRIVAEFVPDVALVDLGMPVMDGFELSRRLRELPTLAAMRLVAITGYGQPQDVAATRDAGFDAHLVKPVAFEQIQATLARLAPAASS
jgi:signal transduction histidine kinase/ActR/RegA family two-component response regulator